jgi:hypothetical protein
MPSMPTGLGCDAGIGGMGLSFFGVTMRNPRPYQPLLGSVS